MASITQAYSEALGKQVFARDFVLNGLFPCQSDFVKMIILQKVEWKFNDKFEYRQLLSNTNTSNTVNTQTFNSDFSMQNEGVLEYGIYMASYGAIMDGFNIDMTKQLETKSSRASFNKEYATRMYSMRTNIASLFKNLAIKGRYGVYYRVCPPLIADTQNNQVRYQMMFKRGGSENNNPTDWVAMPAHRSDDSVFVDENGAFQGAAPTADSLRGGYFSIPITPTKGIVTNALIPGDKIRFRAPIDAYHSNFKAGRLLGRAYTEAKDPAKPPAQLEYYAPTTGRFAPWGYSSLNECWVVSQNQPTHQELTYIGPRIPEGGGTTPDGTPVPGTSDTMFFNRIYFGQSFEIFGNRRVYNTADWKERILVKNATSVYDNFTTDGFTQGQQKVSNWRWAANKIFANETAVRFSEGTGGMQGLGDIIPFYGVYAPKDATADIDDTGAPVRLDINRFFRGQRNRLEYTAEMAGLWHPQRPGQSVMDALLEAVNLSRGVVSWTDVAILINTTTFTSIGMYEQYNGGNKAATGLVPVKTAELDTKLVYQRGISAISYRIGNQIVPNVVLDPNMPTDVIMIIPLKDLSYNCWDNAAFQMQDYITETYSKKAPPALKDLTVPQEFATKLDLGSRITYGSPVALDLSMNNPMAENGFVGYNALVHPSNSLPVAYHEMGALFTPNPQDYTVVKLLNQIIEPSDTCEAAWQMVA